jgi:uncharacterized membrane protein
VLAVVRRARLVPGGGDQLISCLIAFCVVAQFWLARHWVYRQVVGHHLGLAWWNFAFLFTITAMPFTSSLRGQYGGSPLAVGIFAVDMLLASLATQATLLFGQRRDVLIAPADPAEARARGARVMAVVIAVALSVALAWVNTSAARYCWLLIPFAPWWRTAGRPRSPRHRRGRPGWSLASPGCSHRPGRAERGCAGRRDFALRLARPADPHAARLKRRSCGPPISGPFGLALLADRPCRGPTQPA